VILQSNTLQQRVELSKPDKKADIIGPGNQPETLILDGKVDGFVAGQRSLTFPSLKEVAKFVRSQEFQDAVESSRKASPARPQWVQLGSPWSAKRDRLFLEKNGVVHIESYPQKVRIEGDSVALSTEIYDARSGVEYRGGHLIEGRRNARHGYDCTAEKLATTSQSGNAPLLGKSLWGEVKDRIDRLF
jgi:hypothetical protein